jgi:Arc/MetJ-type ribon-helix-helix transcriptional regulator
MRITVRIDENYEQKIKIIQQRTHLNATDVIRQAIDLLYEKEELSIKEKNSRLLAKLAGIGHGPEDGSVNYKHYVAKHIDEKFDHR